MEDDTVVVSPRRLALLVAVLIGAGVFGDPRPALAQAEAAPALAQAEAAPAPPAPKVGDSCRADGDCPQKALCMEGRCKERNKRISALFYYHQPGESGHRVVLPFYFSFWRPERKTQLLLPLFGYSQNHEKKTSDLVLPLLLYQHHKEPGVDSHRVWPIFFYSNYGQKGAALGILPLFYGSRRGPETLAVLPPLLSFYRSDREQKKSDLLVLGMLYSGRRGEERTLVLPPLLSVFRWSKDNAWGSTLLLGWYRRTAEQTAFGAFPLLWHFASKAGTSTALLPLFFSATDKTKGLAHTTLFPLFHYRSEDNGKRRLLVTPLFGRYRDDESGLSVTATLVPPLLHRDEPRGRLTILPPLFLSMHNRETGRQSGYAGPVFWSLDRQGTTAGVAPLFFHFHDRRNQATTDVLLPIFALHRAPGRLFGALGPLYFFSQENKGTAEGPRRGFGLFPLLFAATGRTRYGILAPVFAYHEDDDAGTRHLSLGPFFLRQRRTGPDAGYDAGALPLLFLGRRGAASYQALFPLFLHSRSPYREQLQVGPLYVSRRLPTREGDPRAGVSGALFPLLFWKHTKAESYGVVPPLVWIGRDGPRWTAAIPPLLLFVRSSPSEKLAFGPGFYYQRDPQRTSLVIGPYAHFDRPVPGGRARTDALLPIAFFHRTPTSSAQVIFPLFFQAKEEGTTVRSVALLYWGVARPGLTAHALLPLFARAVTDKASTTVVGPAFYHRRFDGSAMSVGLLPLFGYGRDEKATLFGSVLGFYYRNHQAERTRVATLLFFGDFQKGRSDYGLVPLFFGWRRGSASSWLAPFVYHSEDPVARRSLTVIGPLFFGRRGEATHGGLAPFFFGKNGGDGSYRFTFVPLLHVDHGAGKDPPTRLFTPLFGFMKNAAGYRAYFLTAYLRRDGEVRSEALLPIFYHTYNRLTQSRQLLILPLLFRASSPESTLTVVTPLLWQYKSLTRQTLLAFPLYLDDHAMYQKRLTAAGPFVPLFIRQRDYAAGTTSWIFPPLLTYVKKHPEGHDAVVFPIFWHFRSHEKTTSVLLPVFGYVRRPDYRAAFALPFAYYRDEAAKQSTAVFFPLFYHKSSPEAQTTVVLPILWYARSGAERTVITPLGGYQKTSRDHRLLVLNAYMSWGFGPRAGAWSFHFWPLFSFGRPRRGDLEWYVLGGLVGYSRLGIERTLRLLWFIPVPLEPVGKRSAWYGATLRMGQTREW